ncbi:DUF6048 family protein [Flavobacterium sp.]|uniref:DUF6048 family protein n=1 Tax=Flavobacterium sp. TaxID=239 RepID=UPI00391B81EC
MKYISKFSFSICMVLLSLIGNAQKVTETKKDSIPIKKERYGLRLGVDLFKLTRMLYEEDYRGIELVGDYRLTRRHYLAAEIGNEEKTVDEDQLNFTTSGTYLKVGFDYNTYENWLNMENIISIGLRYGVSSFSQTLNNFEIYNPNNYFEEILLLPGEKYDGLTAQWIEVIAGTKVKVINNVFVGFNFSLKYLVSQKVPDNFDNLYIPGFNRTYDGKFGVGFNYTISYFIPLYKSTVKAKAKSEEKAKKEKKKQ